MNHGSGGGRVDGDRGAREADPSEGSVGDVLEAIRALVQGVDRYRHAIGAELNLGPAEITTLGQLVFDEPKRANEVAERTGLSQGSVTALIDRLERRGYVTRTRPPDNRRVVLVELTATGREVGEGMFRPIMPLLERAAAEPGAPDPVQMAHCLRRIAELLDDLVADRHDGGRTDAG